MGEGSYRPALPSSRGSGNSHSERAVSQNNVMGEGEVMKKNKVMQGILLL